MEKVIKKTQKLIKSAIVIFLFYYSFLFQYIPVFIYHLDVDRLSGNMRMAVLFSAFSYSIIFMIFLIIYWKDIQKEFQTFVKNVKHNLSVGAGSWGVGLLIMMVANLLLMGIFHSEGANNDLVIRSMVHAFPAIMGINVCILAPFIEEVVYRKSLKDVFGGNIVFIILSFLFFGLAHVVSMATSWVDWLYVIPYGAFGGAFAYAYSKTDTVFTSVVFHMIHNTFVFCLILAL